ncbi:Flp family type IVb pilin [Curvibacter sp. CHRR-16]|uniref:Flp family type IVb pilin n=1 Tax=Curvibacter sp. CHRR-16 TaxID=2835872 RepID=UPI001BDA0B6E|nr:Flp family type IVb pilin [Curvibacter sp. CHRR-16]MBT0570739.1 Flp family type IVb pilin [Curvibacter sp. CHRR-16]
MKTLIQQLKSFARDESGVTAIEYGILAAAMAAAVGVIFGSDGAFITALRNKFDSIASDITASGKDIKQTGK